nr:MFS transporter [Beijerinckia indica]
MPSPSQPSDRTIQRALAALAIGSFCIGTSEYVIMGLLPDIARDLDVTIPQAGVLVSAYALSVAFGSPFLAIATARMDRRNAMLVLASVFILGNVLCALAPTYGLLMGARIVTALCHGAFFGIGAVVAAALVPPHKKGQAIAMMFGGLTVANVLGVPFGTALGETLNWRETFWCVAVVGLVAIVTLYRWLPRNIPVPPMQLAREARSLGHPQVILAMLISILTSASLFSVFTYITPILENVTGLSPHVVTLILFLFGVGVTCGNFLGGRLGDWKLMPSVIGILALLIPLLCLFRMTSSEALPAAITVFCWGLLAFAMVPPLQMRVVDEAREAPNLASTLNQGAFNFGNAIGAWIGGLLLTQGLSYAQLPWVGMTIAIIATLFAMLSHWLDGRAVPVTGFAHATSQER